MATNRDDELGGLWCKQSQAGKNFMSGKLTINGEAIEVVVWKNTFKQPGERTPDYRVYRSQPREPRQQLPERGQSTHDASRRAGKYDEPDSEIPF